MPDDASGDPSQNRTLKSCVIVMAALLACAFVGTMCLYFVPCFSNAAPDSLFCALWNLLMTSQ